MTGKHALLLLPASLPDLCNTLTSATPLRAVYQCNCGLREDNASALQTHIRSFQGADLAHYMVTLSRRPGLRNSRPRPPSTSSSEPGALAAGLACPRAQKVCFASGTKCCLPWPFTFLSLLHLSGSPLTPREESPQRRTGGAAAGTPAAPAPAASSPAATPASREPTSQPAALSGTAAALATSYHALTQLLAAADVPASPDASGGTAEAPSSPGAPSHPAV